MSQVQFQNLESSSSNLIGNVFLDPQDNNEHDLEALLLVRALGILTH